MTEKKATTKTTGKKIRNAKIKNPETILFQKKEILLKDLLKDYRQLQEGAPRLNKFQKKAIRRYYQEEALKYKHFMQGVVGFEKDLVRQGTILVKLYFSVTMEEQARRFDRRKTDPLRQWKLSEIDVQAQDRWDDFTNQKYEMLKKTHTNIAPWTIVRSNDKHQARLNAMKVILNSVPYERGNDNLDFVPNPDVVISGSREKELMDAQYIKLGNFIG